MRLLGLVFSFLICSQVFSLAVDEKLPLRILKVSKTQKTVLINRGLEDGLVVGNHAKFFTTEGVIARGVVVKAAPTRTVWSLYRIIDAGTVIPDKVLNLKISTPVKITDDPSKMLSHEDVPQYNTGRMKYYNSATIPYYQGRITPIYPGEPVPESFFDGIPVAKGAKDIDTAELEALENGVKREIIPNRFDQIPDVKSGHFLSHRDWEIGTYLHLSALNSSVVSDDPASEDFSGSVSALNASVGLEKYFPHTDSWPRYWSIGVHLHGASTESTSAVGQNVSSDILEYGGSLSWHMRDPFEVDSFVTFLTAGGGGGQVEDKYSNSASTVSLEEQSVSGNFSSFNLGGGIKYLTRHGFGFRGLADYYQRNEDFAYDDGTTSKKTVSGPRLLLGFFYRW